MGNNKPPSDGDKRLRKEAERCLSRKLRKEPPKQPSDIDALLHELQVHQIQVEMLNEELRNARTELEESRSRYVDLYDFAPVGYLTLDEQGLIEDANLTAASLLGIERGSIIHMPFSLFVKPDCHEAFLLHRQAALRVGKKESCDLVLKRRSGEAFDAHLESVAVETKGHRVIRTILTDITEKKKTARRLRASEARYRNLFNDPILGVFQSTPDGKLITVNPAFARMLGYSSPDELMARVSDIASDLYADPSRRPSTARMIMEAGRVMEFDNLYRRKDGSTFVGNLHAWASQDAKGQTIFEGFVDDVSDRRKAEELLRESERMSRATIDALPMNLCVLDEQGTILDVNRSWKKFADDNPPVPPNYTVGMNYLSVCDNAKGPNSEEAAPFAAGIRAVMSGDIDEFSLEYPCHSSEEERWFIGGVTRFPGDGPLRLVIAHKDITDRKNAEEALKASLREKEVLLKEIHHRVKNNLQVMSSLLNLQAQHVGDSAVLRMLRDSMGRIKTMALIHEKLYRSKDLSHIYFPDYVADLTRDLIGMHTAGKEIYLNLDVGPAFFDIDVAIPLGLIINELVSNALKHAFVGTVGGMIRIGLYMEDNHATLVVSDTGIGFPEDLDFMNTPSLGMQLVVTLAEQIDATIELKRDKGTEFSIRFRTEE